MPDLSIIILTHNAKDFLKDTLKSVEKQKGLDLEVIVVDNKSTDETCNMLKKDFPHVKLIERDTNVGFSSGNNAGLKEAHADTILFLNPDIQLEKPSDLKKCYKRLHQDDSIGALSPRVNLVSGGIDETCHRGFPTPWASFTHFSRLEKLFPKLAFFSQYSKSYLGYDSEHEIDSLGGMFMMMKRRVGEQVGWWDEDFLFYGEDLDFCFRIKEAGYRNLYYPEVQILHFKGATTGMNKKSRKVSTAKLETVRRVRGWSIMAMDLFYDKHYRNKYPFFVTWIVKLGIRGMYFLRVTLG